MKILNRPNTEPTGRYSCSCGAELEYTNADIYLSDDTVQTRYIICPSCGQKINVAPLRLRDHINQLKF